MFLFQCREWLFYSRSLGRFDRTLLFVFISKSNDGTDLNLWLNWASVPSKKLFGKFMGA